MRRLLSFTAVMAAPFLLFAACGEGPSLNACGEDEVFSEGKCFQDLGVAVNGVGMLPQRKKWAVFSGDDASFEVVNAKTKAIVYSGTAAGPQVARDTKQVVYFADFSEFREEGSFFVQTKTGKKSAHFEIGRDALGDALRLAMLGMTGQRCGVALDFSYGGERYRHAACHLAEASLEDEGGGFADDTGGWHDAGDYGKYVVNGAFAVAFLVAAYEQFPDFLRNREFELPEKGGATPDILDEARIELEWILKTQFADGSFSHKVTARHFEAEVMPERDLQDRFFYTRSTAATGDAVGALAQAARVFREFDDAFATRCLDAAKKGQDFLDANQAVIQSELTPDGTGPYQTGKDADARWWALSELWETSGDSKYLTDFEQRVASASFGLEFDWANASNLALGTYLRSKREGRDPVLVERLTASLAGSAETLHEASLADVYGRDTESYYWGTNGVVCRTSYNLALAHSVFNNGDFLDTISLQLGHVFGLNGFGRSYVTQLGPNPAVAPHHRPSQSDSAGKAWPGLIIGGPHGQATGVWARPDIEPALDWQDKSGNYFHNEIAINWNTALIYALVAALATENDGTDACWPDNCYEVPVQGTGGGDGMGGAGN